MLSRLGSLASQKTATNRPPMQTVVPVAEPETPKERVEVKRTSIILPYPLYEKCLTAIAPGGPHYGKLKHLNDLYIKALEEYLKGDAPAA